MARRNRQSWTFDGSVPAVEDTKKLSTRQLTANDMDVFFQPIVDLVSGRQFGVEALARCKRGELRDPVVLFDRGREIIRIEAFLKAFHVQSVMDYVASGAYQRQPNLQRYLSERAQALSDKGQKVDIWK